MIKTNHEPLEYLTNSGEYIAIRYIIKDLRESFDTLSSKVQFTKKNYTRFHIAKAIADIRAQMLDKYNKWNRN
ncbi:MAG: hypothetical protein ACTSVI_05940 [Promethearchaeota archaeon]